MSTSFSEGPAEVVLVRRHLKLDHLKQLQIELLAEVFAAEPGVAKVVVRKQWLDIDYDAAVLTLDRVIAILEAHGGELSQDWWTAFKAGWYRRREEKLRSRLNEDKES
ncbi:hypothetical protein [Oceanisphaera psychrotolerans]|uniref:Cation transporter n=1 Tax=Oceanisphaera psychrotolerans TaxID=1414654 RepID=A0A1J4QEZ7_9GAMM|nr:hypothetical protein [Oceanisphaera psychrotolerans]OIN11131.1 hypothetical protein BFR47_12330 [Oceanisphaera psychrotolerans]